MPSIRRPSSLEYHNAFDLSVSQAVQRGGAIHLFARNGFFAREILARLAETTVTLVPVGDWLEENNGAILGVESGTFTVKLPDEIDGVIESAIWAEPDRLHGKEYFSLLQEHFSSGSSLIIITSNFLARMLPEWNRPDGLSGNSPAGSSRTIRWLRQNGFSLVKMYGFHGLLSTFWGYAFRAMMMLRRPDLADRCLYKMRETYCVTGWQAKFAPVSVLVARRKKNHAS